MNKTHVKKVQDALGHLFQDVKSVVVEDGKAYKFISSFVDRNGQPFVFYAYTMPKSASRIFLSDMGLILRQLQKSGMGVELGLVQSLLRTYELTFTQNGITIDDTSRPMEQRIIALFQAWAAADGVMRTWTRPKG